MTTALLSLFAACTNDDFISIEQGIQSGDAAMRPSVNVTLNVEEGGDADTRLAFGTKYEWEVGDTIGALLMDVMASDVRPNDDLEAWQERPWVTRYELVDYVKTDYPFTRQDNGTWTTNTKMLEGNYFFAYPFASYKGNREAVHSIGEQVQNGRDGRSSYADNQFFVGYGRIFAGTEGNDVLNSTVEMTPVLGAIGITIESVAEKDFTVEKIVLTSPDFRTLIKLDPTQAKYVGEEVEADPTYNLNNDLLKGKWGGKDWGWTTNGNTYFNYANYEGNFEDEYGDGNNTWVNNTAKSENYDRAEALRSVVTKVLDSEERAELTIVNSPVLKTKDKATFVIMTNEWELNKQKTNNIEAWVYTSEGIVGPVVISGVKKEVNDAEGVTVIADNVIEVVSPTIPNNVTLQMTDNSLQAPAEMQVYNDSDLAQLIEWHEGAQGVYTAFLNGDVTLTKEMSDMLIAADWKNAHLIIDNKGYTVTLASDVAANILDYVLIKGEVKVENKLTLGEKSYLNGSYKLTYQSAREEVEGNYLTITKNGEVTVASAIKFNTNGQDYQKQVLNLGKNEGKVTFNAAVDQFTIDENKGEMTVNAAVTFINNDDENNNSGKITVTEKGNLRGATGVTLVNNGVKHGTDEEGIVYAEIINNGLLSSVENGEYGKVIVGAGTNVTTTLTSDSEGVVDVTANIESKGTFSGEKAYSVLSGKEISLKKIAEAGITELTLDGGKVTAPEADVDADGQIVAAAITKFTVTENGGALGGADALSFLNNANIEVEINGDVTLENVTLSNGAVNPTNILVKKGVTTIKGTVSAKGRNICVGSYDEKAYVAHEATVQVENGATLIAYGFAKASNHDNFNISKSKVNNDGTIKLMNTGSENVTPTGTPFQQLDSDKTGTTIESDDDFANLDPLATTYTINCDLALTTEMIKALSGKNLVLGANVTITGLNAENPLSVKTLTINGAVVALTGTQERTIIIKADKVVCNAELTVTGGWIGMNETGTAGLGTTNISGTNVPDGVIVCFDSDKNLLAYNGGQWVKVVQ